MAVIPFKAKALTDEEEKFKKFRYNLDYKEAFKNVASNHLALYRELNCRFQKLVATICLLHDKDNDFNLTSASKFLMQTNETWNSRSICGTIRSVHYYLVVASRRKTTGNFQLIIKYEDHMLTLSTCTREPIEIESIKKEIVAAETGHKQRASISKTERIKRTLLSFNRDYYRLVKLYRKYGLTCICNHKETSSNIKGNNNQNDDLKSFNKEPICLKEKLSQLENKLSQSGKDLQECKSVVKEMGQLNREVKNLVIKTDSNFMQKYSTVLAFVAKTPLDPVFEEDLIQLLTALLQRYK